MQALSCPARTFLEPFYPRFNKTRQSFDGLRLSESFLFIGNEAFKNSKINSMKPDKSHLEFIRFLKQEIINSAVFSRKVYIRYLLRNA